ncbi:hypothetical protein [Actinomadura sp. B10D3]|uniref:hypothetical protein n=1 Tax=Actinomadura sp. B10D3 TaxID=3153557 RepID=UPI00325D308B
MASRVTCWYGHATGSWWAVARDGAGRWRLVEAASQVELGRRLVELGVYGVAVPPARPAAVRSPAPRYHYL